MMRHTRHSRHRRHYINLNLVVLLLSVALAACGQATASYSGGAGTPTAPAATATLAVPTATPPPLTFSKQWANASIGPAPGALAFALTNPSRGYACDPFQGPAGGTPKWFAVTTDGGVSWMPVANTPYLSGMCTVFIDQADPADVFVQWYAPIPAHITSYRSRNGGATWQQLGALTLNKSDAPWTAVAIVGVRIIVTVGAPYAAAGPEQLPPNDLFASDDGGATWQQIGQSIANQNLNVRNLIAFGSTLVVRAHLAGCCGDAAPLTPAASNTSNTNKLQLGGSLSGGPPPNLYFKSSDGGRTWAQMNLPADHVVTLRTALSPVGAYYLVALADNVDPTNLVAGSLYYSDTSGDHWQLVRPVDTQQFPQVDPGTVGTNGNLVILNDGSIVASFWHSTSDSVNALPDAGVLRTRVDQPSWAPLAPGSTFGWQVSQTTNGTRLWGFAGSGGPPSLVYITIDPITT